MQDRASKNKKKDDKTMKQKQENEKRSKNVIHHPQPMERERGRRVETNNNKYDKRTHVTKNHGTGKGNTQ